MSWHPRTPAAGAAGTRTIPAGAGISPPGAGGIPVDRCTTTSSAIACRRAARPSCRQLSMLMAIGLFLLSPVTLFAWAAGQVLLRVTGLRWWKLALASLATMNPSRRAS